MGVITVLTIVGTAAIMVNFLERNLPGNPGPHNSSVRIAVALNGDKGDTNALRHAAGPAPLVNAFNENQHLCGTSDNLAYITSGSFLDVTIDQTKGPGEQATALQIIPTKNELCIAYISQTWADGSNHGWLGDMGRGCNKDWYYSNIVVGDDHKPTCTWIDNDHSHGIKTAALQIHMQDFTLLTGHPPHDPHFYCSWPTMLFQSDIPDYRVTEEDVYSPKHVAFWDDSDGAGGTTNDGVSGTENDKKTRLRRSSRSDGRLARRSGMAAFSHLIASPHEGHSARELCGSESAHGPDFFSAAEGVFCDMETKTHWPLCDAGGRNESCYHWDTHSLVLGTDRLARNYSHVVEWE